MERKRKPNTGLRVDKWVGARFPVLNNRHIEEALTAGLIVDTQGRRLKKGDKLEPGIELDASRLQALLQNLTAGNRDLRVDVVAEKEAYWVVDKPPGMPSHPLSLFDTATLTHWAFAQRPELATQFPQAQPTITPHRLDTGTSGLVVVAKGLSAYEEWRQAFSQKQVEKRYLAWCWGKPSEEAFEVVDALAHDTANAARMKVADGVGPRALPAHTRVRVRVRQEAGFLAEVQCATGVMHQVRVHLALRGYPLVGDALYDPAYASRSLKPSHHLLRAVEIKRGNLVYQAPSEKFEAECALKA